MLFRDAVEATADVAQAYLPGLQALERVDRARIHCARPRLLAGSVNLDKALSASCPRDERWDYGIGIRKTRASDGAIWVEVHPASSRHIQEVLEKFRWLKQWLASAAMRLEQITDGYVWVASGSVALQPSSPQRRIIAAHGIRFVGERLHL
jgi:hypothetical protein